MADILITRDGYNGGPGEHEAVEMFSTEPKKQCWVYGKKGSFLVVRSGEDAIASVGYACYVDGSSSKETLSHILKTFRESDIGELKKRLVGQYVLMVKKGKQIHLLSDIVGARNIFVADEGVVISTSFSKVEDLVGTASDDLDSYKVFEYLAMRHVLYPTWIGCSTGHRRIKWLSPYEYLVIDMAESGFRIGSVTYSIDNEKQSDVLQLSDKLLACLRAVIGRTEFVNSSVAASLTGGRDSRLVARIAAEQFPHVRFRTAVSTEKFSSVKDLEVATKVAEMCGVPIDVYHFRPGQDEARFRELTEGFAPTYNHSITPVIDGAASYALGFGGIFGTELFMPVPSKSIDEYIHTRIEGAKRHFRVDQRYWDCFRDALHDEFIRTKKHYQLSFANDQDYIRLFNLTDTSRYGSFIISAFNRTGLQLEPYGSYGVLELALRVAPDLWGNHRRVGGDALVQQSAMAKIDPRAAAVLTYKTFRPMLPLSASTLPLYMGGYLLQAAHWIKERSNSVKAGSAGKDFPGGHYISNGWESQFLERMGRRYGS